MNRILLPLILLLFTQKTSAQPQDLPVLTGIVVNFGTAEPVSRVIVVVSSLDGRLHQAVTATTDLNGRFAIPNIPAGDYRITAERDGYVRAEYGQRFPTRPGLPFTVRAEERNEVILRMAPTGVISGRVTTREGEPLRDVAIQALAFTYANGQLQVMDTPMQEAITDDRGDYRLFGLAPRRYFVRAIPPESPRIEQGRILQRRREVETRGGLPADRIIGSIEGPIPAAALTNETYVPMYYPGAVDQANAAPLDLPAGSTVWVDFTAERITTARLKGRIIDGATGQPVPAGRVMLFARAMAAMVRDQPFNGTFEFAGLVPGSYVLFAMSGAFSASQPLEIARDAEDVQLILQPVFRISGRVAIQGQSASEAGRQLQTLRIGLDASGMGSPGDVQVQQDGSFFFPAGSFLMLGWEYQLQVRGLPPDWYVKAARFGQRDVRHSSFPIDNDPDAELQILLSNDSGSLDAAILDENGRPAPAIRVAVVPEPPLRHVNGLYRTATTDRSGRIRLVGIPPGNYRLFVEDLEPANWQDPEIIRRYEHRATAVRIDPNGQIRIEVRALSPP